MPLTREHEAILWAVNTWLPLAREEVNDIEGWRDAAGERPAYSADPRRGWPLWDKRDRWGFWQATQEAITWLMRQSPKADPDPLLNILEAVEAWHTDHNASRIPPQAILESDLQRAANILGAIRDASRPPVGEPEPPPSPSLTPEDRTILEALADEYPMTVTQEGLAGKTRLTERTIGKRLAILRDSGLVSQPHGPKKGHTITPKGLALIGRQP